MKDRLANKRYFYERFGYDKRIVHLLADGTIGEGAAGMERFWDIVDNKLVFKDGDGRITLETIEENGIWKGKWLYHEQMPIIITPKELHDSQNISDEETTILIQGKLNQTSLDNINNYRRFGKIIISCWETDDMSLLANIAGDYILIRNSYCLPCQNAGNICKQLVSTFNGLKHCDTKYCIKVRSDESYSDLSEITKALKQNDSRIVTNNIFFTNRPYNSSDHLIAGKTEILLNGFKHAFDVLNGTIPNPLPISLTPESIICIGTLIAFGENPQYENWIDLMKKRYHIVPVSLLGKFFWRVNTYGIWGNMDDMNSRVARHHHNLASVDELEFGTYKD